MEHVPTDPSPVPVACCEDEDIARKKASSEPSTAATTVSTSTDTTSISGPTTIGNDDTNGDGSEGLNQSGARQVTFSNSSPSNERLQSEGSSRPDVVAGSQTAVSSLGATSSNPTINLEHGVSFSVIPEAFPVEEDGQDEVAQAKVVLPWWKRKRTYAILIVVIAVIIGASVGISQYVKRQVVLLPTNSTQAPSVSMAPSSSQMPSSQPSACVEQSSVDPRTLEFLNFNMTYPLCAIDGEYSVVADIHADDGIAYLYVTFYELSRFDSWEKTQQFIEYLSAGNDTDLDAGSWAYQSDWFWSDTYSLAMSKYTVLVGTPFVQNGTGDVYVYEYNEGLREWMRSYEAIYPALDQEGKRFGQAVDIDNDLAVVNAPGEDTVYLYLFGDSGWNKALTFEIANTTDVIVSGDTIALVGCEVHLFHYNREMNTMERHQEIDETYFCDMGPPNVELSGNHLAVSAYSGNFGFSFSDNGCYSQYGSVRAASAFPLYATTMYSRPDNSTDFSYIQVLNSSDFEQGLGASIALEEDFLLISGAGNKTHAFSFEDGYWQESLEFVNEDQCGEEGHDDKVYISNRNAMVSTVDDIRIYNLHQCAPMPTSVPSE